MALSPGYWLKFYFIASATSFENIAFFEWVALPMVPIVFDFRRLFYAATTTNFHSVAFAGMRVVSGNAETMATFSTLLFATFQTGFYGRTPIFVCEFEGGPTRMAGF